MNKLPIKTTYKSRYNEGNPNIGEFPFWEQYTIEEVDLLEICRMQQEQINILYLRLKELEDD